jgi:hypothetical protein
METSMGARTMLTSRSRGRSVIIFAVSSSIGLLNLWDDYVYGAKNDCNICIGSFILRRLELLRCAFSAAH